MIWRFTSQMILTILVLFTYHNSYAQVSLSTPKIWTPEERTGLEKADDFQFAFQRFISVLLNPDNPEEGNFDLYYFVQTPINGKGLRTILFCAGGPGDLARPNAGNKTFADFLVQSGYNVVYFDLRGSGFSQIPPSNRFDRFLRTAYAVEDIERIRHKVLGDKKWDAIVGYSYGTVLAQQYAYKYQHRVEKVVLVGPLSMHKFASSTAAYDEYSREFQRIRREVLDVLYKRDEFKLVKPEDKTEIMDELFGTPTKSGIFQKVEDVFGSEQFVIDAYCDLRGKGVLKKYGLPEYSRRFFEVLRKIRLVGWQAVPEAFVSLGDEQLEIVKVISLGLKPDLRKVLGEMDPDSECPESYSRKSNRVFNVMGVYDGLNRRFLREWLVDGKRDIHDALARSAGVAHQELGVNTTIDKVGIVDGEPVVPWDPAKYRHGVPTLILKGGADPVTTGGQAEYFYTDALGGPRTLIEFEGVGHHYHFPRSGMEKFTDGTVSLDPPHVPSGRKAWVTGTMRNVQTLEWRNVSDGDLDFRAVRLDTDSKVYVQVVNKSNNTIHMPDKQFPINDSKFKGILNLDRGEIPGNAVGNAVTWVPGKITVTASGIKFNLAPPSNLEEGLKFTGEAYTDSWNRVYVEIINNRTASVDGAPRNWIYKPSEIALQRSMCVAEADVKSLTCLIYAFVEMEYPDFIDPRYGILGRIRVFAPRSKNCWEKGCDPIGN